MMLTPLSSNRKLNSYKWSKLQNQNINDSKLILNPSSVELGVTIIWFLPIEILYKNIYKTHFNLINPTYSTIRMLSTRKLNLWDFNKRTRWNWKDSLEVPPVQLPHCFSHVFLCFFSPVKYRAVPTVKKAYHIIIKL